MRIPYARQSVDLSLFLAQCDYRSDFHCRYTRIENYGTQLRCAIRGQFDDYSNISAKSVPLFLRGMAGKKIRIDESRKATKVNS
jgi:hypothetical protein